MPNTIYGRKDAVADLETKFHAVNLEFKADDESDEYLTVSGYGSVFNVKDKGADVVMPGAFADSIASGRKPKMLWQHDPNQPIGAWDEIREDDQGLYMKGRISKKAAKGAEVAALVKMGAVEGLSIGYSVAHDGFKMDSEEGVRRLIKLDLWETSVVTFPMNELANIYAMKSADDMSETEIKRYIEKALKKINVSGSMAKAMASGAMEGRKGVLREADVLPPEDDQREVDALKALLTETLQKMEAPK